MGATVHDVVRDVIAEVAPHELPLVEGLSRLDPDRVARLLRRRHRQDELGFGLAEAVAVLTPVLTPIVWIAVDEASRMGVTKVLNVVGGWIRAVLRRRGGDAQRTVPALNREQLAAVHERVRSGATAAGLDAAAARSLADHVVARLALEASAPTEVDP